MKVEVIGARPRCFAAVVLELPAGATVAQAVELSGLAADADIVGYAIFGRRAEPATMLRDADRLELLRPLQADPKEARRRRAESRSTQRVCPDER